MKYSANGKSLVVSEYQQPKIVSSILTFDHNFHIWNKLVETNILKDGEMTTSAQTVPFFNSWCWQIYAFVNSINYNFLIWDSSH